MDVKKALGAVGALVLLGLLYALFAGDEDAKTAIRKVIDRAVLAAEQKKLGGVMEAVSDGFSGPYAMNKDELRRLVFVQLQRGEWRRIFVLNPKIEVEDGGQAAHVAVTAVLARGDEVKTPAEALQSAKADAYAFEIDFALEDGDWRVRNIAYRRADPKDLLESLIP